MTIAQIIAACLAGPFFLMTFLQLVCSIIYKNANYYFWQGIVLVFSAVALAVAFFGIQ